MFDLFINKYEPLVCICWLPNKKHGNYRVTRNAMLLERIEQKIVTNWQLAKRLSSYVHSSVKSLVNACFVLPFIKRFSAECRKAIITLSAHFHAVKLKYEYGLIYIHLLILCRTGCCNFHMC